MEHAAKVQLRWGRWLCSRARWCESAREFEKEVAAANRQLRGLRDGPARPFVTTQTAVDLPDEQGNSALLVAAQNGRLDVLRACMRLGCAVDHQNRQGQTALHFAYSYGYDGLYWELKLEGGADDELRNGAGRTCYEGLKG